MGNAHLAAHWRAKAARLKPAIAAAFFDAKRGLFASDAARRISLRSIIPARTSS